MPIKRGDEAPTVIHWSGAGWGIACRRKDGRRVTYQVGSKNAASAEANRIAEGGEPRTADELIELRK